MNRREIPKTAASATGPDHPQIGIYNGRHGIAFQANKADMNLDNAKWVVGVDYSAALRLRRATSATQSSRSRDVGMRISWNNRPAKSVRPEISDAKMGRRRQR